MKIRFATEKDIDYLTDYDGHVSKKMLVTKVENKQVIVAYINNEFAGFLRFGFFWDEIPFMNMLFVLEKFRQEGIATALVKYWVKEFEDSHTILLTSTLSDETSQHFYRKLSYQDIGGFVLPGESMELILMKQVSK